jgi:hypothetical protein
MSKSRFENLEIYQLSGDLADFIWEIALTWDYFAKDTIGEANCKCIRQHWCEHSGRFRERELLRF